MRGRGGGSGRRFEDCIGTMRRWKARYPTFKILIGLSALHLTLLRITDLNTYHCRYVKTFISAYIRLFLLFMVHKRKEDFCFRNVKYQLEYMCISEELKLPFTMISPLSSASHFRREKDICGISVIVTQYGNRELKLRPHDSFAWSTHTA